jgi:phosphate transport system substrate-binding protein
MSVRLVRSFSIALLATCMAASVVAKTPTHHHARHAKAKEKSLPTLIWRGDVATAQGVVNEVALAWQKTGHGKIELQPFNTASGIDAVSSGMADLAGSARPSDNSTQNSNLTFTPVAWDALVMVTQASNPVNNLTLQQVRDIYLGKITNWSQVGGNSAPIDLYAVASPGDGVEYSLRTLLFGRGNQPVAAPRLYVNTSKLEEGVELNPNGLGASTLAEISNSPKLKAIPINGISPNATTVGNGAYVLFIPIYLVTNPRNPKAAEVATFLQFMQSDEAKAAMRAHGVLPYQDGAALAAIDASRRTTIFAALGVKPPHVATTIAAATAPAAPTAPTSASQAAAASALSGTIAAGKVQDQRPVTAAATSSSQVAGRTYTVVKGDTLSGIAKKTGSSVADLRTWNHLKNDNIRLGQELHVSHE